MNSESKQNLVDVTKQIGSVVGVPVQDVDIRDVYRFKLKDNSDGPIIVELNTKIKKENFIESTITYNKGKGSDSRLNTEHLKMNGPIKPIYVAKALTKRTKHLQFLARVFKKNHKSRVAGLPMVKCF
ncbi:unnamed protein product [Arctia plantaginis]|uniref:Uncharacterized protein n=1 Tax=Arctia plantaginis TaxID=874455 RepID=A0A8S1B971_ARCPL|nr:unnamed protein product [Arctia plantaginis]